MVWQVKQLLEDNGIPCFIKNEFAIGALGELSPLDCLPEVWINDEGWKTRAQRFIDEMDTKNVALDSDPWQCTNCHESNESTFEICWKCSQGRPD